MKEIDPEAGTEVVLSCLRVLALRLKSRPDTRDLFAAVDAARADLKARSDAFDEAHDATLAATGSVVFADDQEDDAVAGFGRRVRVLVDGNLKSDLYLRLFAQAPSLLTKGVADETQADLVTHLIDTVGTKPEYASLRDLLPGLVEARAEVMAAREERVRCERAEAAAWNEVQIAEKKGREIHRDTRPKLELLFPGRKRLVDSFFYKKKKRPAKQTKPVVVRDGEDG